MPIPPTGSGADYARKLAALQAQQEAARAGGSTGAGETKGAQEGGKPPPIGHMGKTDQTGKTSGLGGVENPPVLIPPGSTVSIADQIRALNAVATAGAVTPAMAFTLFQAESLMRIQTSLDPKLAAAFLGRLQQTTTPQQFAQAIEDGLVQYFNPDGTPKEELQALLDGKGDGAYLTSDGVPEAAKEVLAKGENASEASKKAFEDYISAVIEKGFGGGSKLSPMFALMLLLVQYNNMRSVMDDKLAMVRQNAIKAGYDAQVSEIMIKAYTALGAAVFTAAATAASVTVQVKGVAGKATGNVEDEASLQQLKDEKVAVDKDIGKLKQDMKPNQDILRPKEIADDLAKNPNAKYADEKKLAALDDPDATTAEKVEAQGLKDAGYKPAPKDVLNPDNTINRTKLTAKVAENADKVEGAQERLDVQERTLDRLERRSDMKARSIEEKDNTILSKHNTKNQAAVTSIQGVIQFVGSASQFIQSWRDANIKQLEYQVTEDTFYQRQLGTNQQQSDQSISSLRQSAAQIEESTSGTLSGIARSIV